MAKAISLIPVVEFEPGAYSTHHRSLPTGSASENPGDWDRYWRDSLMDSGIEDIDPFHLGSWFVPVSQLTHPATLKAMLRSALDDVEQWGEDDISPLPGGYVFASEEFELAPGCCGDLGNLEEWRSAAEHRSAEWKMVWVGHPWTHVSACGELLTFLHPTEEDPPVTLRAAVSVDRQLLRNAIYASTALVTALRHRLVPIVAELAPIDAPIERITKLLTEGYGNGKDSA